MRDYKKLLEDAEQFKNETGIEEMTIRLGRVDVSNGEIEEMELAFGVEHTPAFVDPTTVYFFIDKKGINVSFERKVDPEIIIYKKIEMLEKELAELRREGVTIGQFI